MKVLRYIDRGDDLILYEPGTAARAKVLVALAESLSSWGDLSQLQSTHPAHEIEPILDHLWFEWDDGNGAWKFGFDEDEDDEDSLPQFSSRVEFLGYFPGDAALDARVYDDDGSPNFLDPFMPDAMGVPIELVPFYVEQDSGSPGGDYWYLPNSSSLPEIKETLERIGWTLEPGDYVDIPYWS